MRFIDSMYCKEFVGDGAQAKVATIIVSVVNILSSIFVISSYFFLLRKNSVLKMRLLLFTNIFGSVYCVFLVIESILDLSGIEKICQIFSFVYISCIFGMEVWSLSFTIHLMISLLAHLKFKILKRFYKVVEYLFFVISFVVIPAPFFLLVFIRLPIGRNGNSVCLLGSSNTGFCFFNSRGLSAEKNLSLLVEFVVFFVPILFILFLNFVLYSITIFKMCTQRKQFSGLAKKLIPEKTLSIRPSINIRKVFQRKKIKKDEKFYRILSDDEGEEEDGVDRKNTGRNMNQHHKESSDENEDDTMNTVVPRQDHQQQKSREDLFVFINPYQKFVQKQTFNAVIYITLTFLNWGIWMLFRVLWDVVDCNSHSVGWFFFFSLIISLTGPRIECILISILYGFLEILELPTDAEEILFDSKCLPFFREYCGSLRKNEKLVSFGGGSNWNTIEHDNFLFFFFDLMKLLELSERLYKKNENDDEKDDDDSNKTYTRRQVIKSLTNIVSNYISESGAFQIPTGNIETNDYDSYSDSDSSSSSNIPNPYDISGTTPPMSSSYDSEEDGDDFGRTRRSNKKKKKKKRKKKKGRRKNMKKNSKKKNESLYRSMIIMSNRERNKFRTLVSNLSHENDVERFEEDFDEEEIEERLFQTLEWVEEIKQRTFQQLEKFIPKFRKTEYYSQMVHLYRMNRKVRKSNLYGLAISKFCSTISWCLNVCLCCRCNKEKKIKLCEEKTSICCCCCYYLCCWWSRNREIDGQDKKEKERKRELINYIYKEKKIKLRKQMRQRINIE